MSAKGKKVRSMTCAKANDIAIAQEVLDKDSLPWANVGFTQRLREVRVMDGKHVALVGVSNNATREAGGQDEPHLKCACDFHRVQEANCVRMLVNTFDCERKRTWGKERRKQVGAEYLANGVVLHDAILDLCDRVWNKGEYVGQTEGSWLYVQHVAEMFDMGIPTVLTVVAGLHSEKRVDLNGMVLTPYTERKPDIPSPTRTPMVSWENIDPSEVNGLVWASKLDGRFQVEVQRKNDEHKGVLCVFDHDANDALLHAVDVGLSYGARFGPDVDDVLTWEALVTEFIDKNFPAKK